jgi:hypothetical protein
VSIDNDGDGGVTIKKKRIGGFVNGEFYGFARLSLSLAGEAIMAFSRIDYTEEVAFEPLYGAGSRPVAMRRGDYLATVSLEVYREDFDYIIRKKIKSLLDQDDDGFDMALILAKRKGKATVTDRFSKVFIEKIAHSAGSGDMGLTVQLECKCLGGITRL